MNSGNKREDVQIYILSHKKEDFILDNSLYTPIELGAYYNDGDPIYDIRDNDDIDNISYLNPIFLEQTGTYYIYKHLLKNQKYIGINQHRRQFEFDENTNFDVLFDKYKVVLYKYDFYPYEVKKVYALLHNINDFIELENIIHDNYSSYNESLEKLKKLNYIYANCCIVTSNEIFKDYFNFYFNIAWEFIKRKKLYNTEAIFNYGKQIADNKKRIYSKYYDYSELCYNDKYQMRILGYLQERIMTLYMIHNFSESDILLKQYRKLPNDGNYEFNTIL